MVCLQLCIRYIKRNVGDKTCKIQICISGIQCTKNYTLNTTRKCTKIMLMYCFYFQYFKISIKSKKLNSILKIDSEKSNAIGVSL